MTARFISFEGIDGSGKTTAFSYTCDELEKRGKKVLRTREVGNPHIQSCIKLRELVLNPESNLDGRTMEFIFAAMRIENSRYYESVQNQYDFIVSDREWLSHLSYTDHNVDSDFTEELYYNLLQHHTRISDEIFLFEVNSEVSLARRVKRSEKPDAIELKGPAFLDKVAQSYRLHANRLESTTKTMIHHIDANQDVNGVRNQLNKYIEALCSR